MKPRRGNARTVGLIAILTATCVATNYLMIGFVNVKFMDLIVFCSGFRFGSLIGGLVGFLTWLVYGTINPYGFSFPILLATSIGESMYGIVGGLLGGLKLPEGGVGRLWFMDARFAFIGFILTFIYDLFTNIVTGLVVGMPLTVVLLAGIPFALLHELSNTVFFFVGASPLLVALRRLTLGGLDPPHLMKG
ncbi:hypothetical protein KEJ49_05200 [Candidatus Bathyarchaeota archaeon]|nr:hypothetical protein [Candidatus Bathyarchaeota archaeon]